VATQKLTSRKIYCCYNEIALSKSYDSSVFHNNATGIEGNSCGRLSYSDTVIIQ